MRNSLPQSLDSLFKATPLLTIQERGLALAKLNRLLANILPEKLSEQCQIINYRQGVLIIGVSSAGWLVRLRYEQEKLRSQLRQNGLLGLSSIQFKVNPALNLNSSVLHCAESNTPQRIMTSESANYLLALADNCSTNLKSRLIKLASHAVNIDNKASR